MFTGIGFDAKGGLLLFCSHSNARVLYAFHMLANVESRFTLVNIHQSVLQPVQDIHNQIDWPQKNQVVSICLPVSYFDLRLFSEERIA